MYKNMKLIDLPNHHAVLIVNSERDTVGVTIFKELKALSPVHRFFNQTVLDIETARAIILWAQTPYNEEKIALISFHTIGLEAQNALLKILEEPRVGVRFILITSNKANLIDTVLSRVLLVREEKNTQSLEDVKTFLTTKHNLRMKLPCVTNILSQLDEEGRKNREIVRDFILSLTTVLIANKVESKYIKETFEVASYAADPSASSKALIEYLSLLLPIVK